MPVTTSLARLIKEHGDQWIIGHAGASTAWVAVRRDDLRIVGAHDVGDLKYHIEQAPRALTRCWRRCMRPSPTWGRSSPLMDRIFPPTATGRNTSGKVARSARSSRTLTLPRGTGRLSPPARRARSKASRSTRSPTPRPTFPSRGSSARPRPRSWPRRRACSMRQRGAGSPFDVVVADKGYDAGVIYELVESIHAHPVIPLTKTKAVKDGKHRPPKCDHGEWTFAGSDAKRQASKWRCPTGECAPRSVWIKASRLHTLIPRSTDKFRTYYRKRGSVERGFGRVKHEWGGLPLRVRRIPA